jgi:pimeloyl-ACP methyl ester carboxylesterase
MEQDFRRTLEYLETRADIDQARIGYFGTSLGAYFGPIPLALEHRLSLGILIGGGLIGALDPEVDNITYLPHVTVPVLFLCGRYDYFFPYEASQRPFFERLGTPSEDKRHVIVDSAHSVPRSEYLREVLSWLDRYYGAAR